MSTDKKYEPGMRITFNDATKAVAVAFRGRLITLSGPYPTREPAIRAGEDYCRKQGWIDRSPDDRSGQSMIKRNP